MKRIVLALSVLALTPALLFAQSAGVKERRPLPCEYGRVIISSPNPSPELADDNIKGCC